MAFQSGAFQSPGFQQVVGVVPPPVAEETGAGRSSKKRRRERYIARYKGEDHEFDTVEELEAFVEEARAEQSVQPKRKRDTVRITLTPGFAEQIEPVVEAPKRLYAMPTGAAMAQVRRIEQALLQVKRIEERRLDDEYEEEILLWLM